MSAITAAFVLGLAAMILITIVLILALRTDRPMKASAKIGAGSFDIETKD